MASFPPPEFFTDSLLQERDLLHLILYRNKNQHRRSVWFKWLRMLKRDVEKLLVGSGQIAPSEARSTASSSSAKTLQRGFERGVKKRGQKASIVDEKQKGKKTNRNKHTFPRDINNKKYDPQEWRSRLEHLMQVVMPGCHAAFTHLIKDTQFSALGMVLVAVLARVYAVVRESYPGDDDLTLNKEHIPISACATAEEKEDYGEIVSREGVGGNKGAQSTIVGIKVITPVDPHDEMIQAPGPDGDEEATPPPSLGRIRSSQGPADAIDELFDSLF